MTYPTYDTTIDTRYRKPGDWAAGFHTGVDFAVPTGTRVDSPCPSTIVHTGRHGGWGGAYGIHVIGECIIGGKRYRWMSAHLSKTSVKKGAHVATDQLVGLSGETGNATGPHDHFEVREEPFGYYDHVDPQILLDYKAGPVDKMDPANYGPGHVGPHVTWLGERLVAHGYGRFYKVGPGPVWGEADRAATRAFQLDQGWTGEDANGLVGRESLRRLAAAPKPATVPAKVIDLRRAKLTTPLGKENHPTEITQPALARYSNAKCFFVRANDVIFRVTGSGVTTENSDNPRSELREMELNGSRASWDTRRDHRLLEAIYRVTGNTKVVLAQIHDAKDDVVMVSWQGGRIVVEWSKGKGNGSDKKQVATVKAGESFKITIEAKGGEIVVKFNGRKVDSRKKSLSGCYQKAGAYLQSDDPNHWAEVAMLPGSLKMGAAA